MPGGSTTVLPSFTCLELRGMHRKRWIFPNGQEKKAVEHLMDVLAINQALAEILVNRGIQSYDHAKDFFRPDLNMLHDPFQMKGMDQAVDRLVRAITNGEKVLIYGDYDVDGTTSVAMFFHFLSSFYEHCDYYIPNRYTEGYGVSLQGVEFAAENGFSLVITLDCGIKSNELVSLAARKNIDFVICDHHEPAEPLPDAVAILDPKQKDCAYPYKELSGCGVGFKFIQAFLISHPGINFDLFSLLDLVCVSIAADIVPITGENRVLAYHGIKRLEIAPRQGLASLMTIAGIPSDDITISRIVFGIAPRINAAGRLEDAKHAVQLLLANSEKPSRAFAERLNDHNNNRQDIDRETTREARDIIINDGLTDLMTTVLYRDHWHKGVIGIVASRCIETYYRPTVIFTETRKGLLTGSARSVEGFDLYAALTKCSDLLEQFGGHKYAAGMTLKNDNLEAFRTRFEEVVKDEITTDQLVPSITIDAELTLADITAKFYRILKQMAPFGPGNSEPVFICRALTAVNIRAFSARNNPDSSHLKLTVTQENIRMEAIGFNLGHFADELKTRPEGFNMVFTIEENRFRGVITLQLYIKDINWE